MVRLHYLLPLLLLSSLAVAQGAFFYDRAIALDPISRNLLPMPNTQVRVCATPAFSVPCTPIASITDINGNPLAVQGGNFGQLTTDLAGRFNFGCSTGTSYEIQIASNISNNLSYQYLMTCGGGNGGGGGGGGGVPAGCTQPSSGILNCNFFNAANNVAATQNVNVGTNLPVACAGASSCIAFLGAASQGTPTAGQAYIRYDSTSAQMKIATELGGENLIPEATGSGKVGQPLLSNGDGTFSPADPFISVTPVTLFTTQSTTGTATSAAAPLSLLSTPGTISYTFAGLSGVYTSCTLQMIVDDGFGNQQNNGTAIGLTMSNGAHTFDFNSGLVTIKGSPKLAATFACSAYGSAGTMTITFTPYIEVAPQNTLQSPVPVLHLEQNGSLGTGLGVPGNGFGVVPLCNLFTTGSANTSGNTQVLAAAGVGAVYHICSVTLVSSSSTLVSAKLVSGSTVTTPCDTNSQDMTVTVPLQAITNSAPVGITISPANVDWKPPAFNNQLICINLSAAQAVNYQVNYAKF